MSLTTQQLIDRALDLISRIECRFFPQDRVLDWESFIAFRWRSTHLSHSGYLEPISNTHSIQLKHLCGVDSQKQRLIQNTRQFISGLPANNVLLWGSRGTGKSSLVKAILNKFAYQGLRLIEVDKHELIHLPDIIAQVIQRPEYFILFCDDLSFEADDPGYKSLKVVLDGSISTAPKNVLVYATSNRRHLLPEYELENQQTQLINNEIHHGEAVEEKIALSDRFGLWLSFYPINQQGYLDIIHTWLQYHEIGPELWEEADKAALQWALARGSRSGRTAWQFAQDFTGSQKLKNKFR
ncbi:ATP-binding protein [Candidatus Nitrosacidococcus tergens]|uniref:AAA+ ATPase domain-containing protein n=1 Tax=Candidatus Nitrosacidococcus tergens TaxID=553981 RepID=A0A7G1Q985_9GAMM|nr:ATP-binding protein [Candidatus Nitrosacidococcus tergens]CAB1275249.1 conserved protein of unknown function [Candidatus Nitrosacidococcus tergens]